MKITRIYLRVSTSSQSIERQRSLIEDAKKQGFYIASVYEEKASGTTLDRPELQRMISEIQPGEYIIAERLDRITRLPPPQAEELIKTIQDKGASLLLPELLDFSQLIPQTGNDFSDDLIKCMIDCTQKVLLKVALKASYDDWCIRRERINQGIAIAKKNGKFKGKQANKKLHQDIIKLRRQGNTIAETARILGTSTPTVVRAWAKRDKTEIEKLEDLGQKKIKWEQ